MKTYTANLDTATIRLFDRYLQECRERKIQLVFLYAPEYIDGQKFISNREEEQYLNSPEGQAVIVTNIVNALRTYIHNLEGKPKDIEVQKAF